MKSLVVLCHPEKDSLTALTAKTAQTALEEAGHDVSFLDLYAEGFDPVLGPEELRRNYSFDPDVQRYMEEITRADTLVIAHPDWWGQMPSLLKGWIDRVFRPGIAFEYVGEEFLSKKHGPLLKGKRGIAFVLTDAPEGTQAHPLISVWEDRIFAFSGIEGVCSIFNNVRESNHANRKAWLAQVESEVLGLLPD